MKPKFMDIPDPAAVFASRKRETRGAGDHAASASSVELPPQRFPGDVSAAPTEDDEPARQTDRATELSVYWLAAALSFLHLCNYLNYSVVRHYLDFPLIRAVFGTALAISLVVIGINYLFSFHVKHNIGAYAFCGACLFSVLQSNAPWETVKYSMWLFFSIYAALELARRVRSFDDLQASLIIIIVPTFALSFMSAMAFGPQVVGEVGQGSFGGRVMGALETHHVDAALALDYGVLFLAVASLGADRLRLSRKLRLISYCLFAFAVWLVVYSLTRSVWLSFTVAVAIYLMRKKKAGVAAIVGLVFFVLIIGASGIAFFDVLPESVQNRLEVTQNRYESGEIDPRIEGIKYGLSLPFTDPLGFGYAAHGAGTHNSYFDILSMVGVPGFLICAGILLHSFFILRRSGSTVFMFFAIGGAPLLLQAFFERQILPGQANFIVLLAWYAMSRSSFLLFPREDPPPDDTLAMEGTDGSTAPAGEAPRQANTVQWVSETRWVGRR